LEQFDSGQTVAVY